MNINDIIIFIMVFFMILGALDKMLGNKFGIGEKFEEGFNAFGPLAISMLGIICLAPVLADVLKPVVVPIFSLFGADPSMFAGLLLGSDMGGAPLAKELAIDPKVGLFSGIIVSSMVGATIVFNIPVGLSIIEKRDIPFLATGVLSGMIVMPIGCFLGGIIAGLPPVILIKNLFPIAIFSILMALGLLKIPNKMISGFTIFGKGLLIIITTGLALAILEKLTGLVIIPGMTPIDDGLKVLGDIVIILAGAFPLVYLLTKILNKPLMKLGSILKINEISAAGLISSLANNIPMFSMVKDMDDRGKIINIAFTVSAGFILGDHLGFTAGYYPNMIFPMIVAKLTSGILGIFVAIFIFNSQQKR